MAAGDVMEAVFGALAPVTFVAALLLERLFPGRAQPAVRGWALRGFVFFLLGGVINAVVPAIVAAAFSRYSPFHFRMASLGIVPGAIVGFLIGDFIHYFVHRTFHRVPFLWRWTHQMHHSAERVDVIGVTYFHPFEGIVFIAIPSLATLLLGLSPLAAALAGYIAAFIEIFQHVNVRTPVWLGYLIQRPEAHSVHHSRGVHAFNYGNFMLWDILFGTFANPEDFASGPSGFWDGASAQVKPMLLGRDVAEPR